MSEYKLNKNVLNQIDDWRKKFPSDQPRSAVIKSLRFIQDHYGWLSDKQLDALAVSPWRYPQYKCTRLQVFTVCITENLLENIL